MKKVYLFIFALLLALPSLANNVGVDAKNGVNPNGSINNLGSDCQCGKTASQASLGRARYMWSANVDGGNSADPAHPSLGHQ